MKLSSCFALNIKPISPDTTTAWSRLDPTVPDQLEFLPSQFASSLVGETSLGATEYWVLTTNIDPSLPQSVHWFGYWVVSTDWRALLGCACMTFNLPSLRPQLDQWTILTLVYIKCNSRNEISPIKWGELASCLSTQLWWRRGEGRLGTVRARRPNCRGCQAGPLCVLARDQDCGAGAGATWLLY